MFEMFTIVVYVGLMIAKNKRIANRELLDFIKSQDCIACGSPGPNTPSHIKTQGSGGPDTWWNVVPKCVPCHTKWGTSRQVFMSEYPHVWTYLSSIGWEFLDRKLWHPLLSPNAKLPFYSG